MTCLTSINSNALAQISKTRRSLVQVDCSEKYNLALLLAPYRLLDRVSYNLLPIFRLLHFHGSVKNYLRVLYTMRAVLVCDYGTDLNNYLFPQSDPNR